MPRDNDRFHSHMGSIGNYTEFLLGSWQEEVSLVSSSAALNICVLCLDKFRCKNVLQHLSTEIIHMIWAMQNTEVSY